MATTYTLPIELRIYKEQQHYVVQKVFPGIGNVSFSAHKHMTYSDAVAWCKQEYPTVPRIRGW